jgi:glycerophosphoryl diester phosphodiesterase
MASFPLTGPAEIIAHRGYSARAPENTLAALRAALEAGADAVEFDLQFTGDGMPVLFHDDELDRTTDGRGPIGALVRDDLAALDAGRRFSPGFAGERIPSLEAALGLLDGGAARIYAEIKRGAAPEAVDRLIGITAEAGATDRTVFISMGWDLLARARTAHEGLRVGYIVCDARDAEAATSLASGDPHALLDFDARILLEDASIAHRARELDIPLAVWTVDDPADATRLLRMGVPRITTNEVERLLAWKAGL